MESVTGFDGRRPWWRHVSNGEAFRSTVSGHLLAPRSPLPRCRFAAASGNDVIYAVHSRALYAKPWDRMTSSNSFLHSPPLFPQIIAAAYRKIGAAG